MPCQVTTRSTAPSAAASSANGPPKQMPSATTDALPLSRRAHADGGAEVVARAALAIERLEARHHALHVLVGREAAVAAEEWIERDDEARVRGQLPHLRLEVGADAEGGRGDDDGSTCAGAARDGQREVAAFDRQKPPRDGGSRVAHVLSARRVRAPGTAAPAAVGWRRGGNENASPFRELAPHPCITRLAAEARESSCAVESAFSRRNLVADQSEAIARVVDGRAWEEFCDTLKAAGAVVLAGPGDPLDRAEGWRYLSRLLRAGLETFVEASDASAPHFQRTTGETVKMGMDNPDNVYLNAPVNGGYDYRIGARAARCTTSASARRRATTPPPAASTPPATSRRRT